MSYIINPSANTTFTSGNNELVSIDLKIFQLALNDVHSVIDIIVKDIPVDIFSVLGMRNLSGFIGELFAISLIKESNGQFIANPHQDGYPDLLLMNDYGKRLYAELTEVNQLQDKAPFSPFSNGGLEIKATCGSVPTPKECAKRGSKKPDMGDTRIQVMQSYDWKAHHRGTNNLVGILCSNSHYGTSLLAFSDLQICKQLLKSLCIRVSKTSFSIMRIAAYYGTFILVSLTLLQYFLAII